VQGYDAGKIHFLLVRADNRFRRARFSFCLDDQAPARRISSPDHMANIKRKCYTRAVDEGRKRTILIAASILAARRLSDWDGAALLPRHVAAISDAIRIAERIMRK